MTVISDQSAQRADQYDTHEDYRTYWYGREYEHQAEVTALRRLLRGTFVPHAVDVGGGYGRLVPTLGRYAEKVTLTDSSRKQLDTAKTHLAAEGGVEIRLAPAGTLPFDNATADLVSMVRVMHHLPDPTDALKEIHRILRHDGRAIIEVANSAHAANRLKAALNRRPLSRNPIDLRSTTNRDRDSIPFVNHHPDTITEHMQHTGFTVERTLSVSNLRHPQLKRLLPTPALNTLEKALQAPLARTAFGPSIFFLLRKTH
ncbi:methyltransferase domain-containing protein [Streptomyces sp. NBC_00859]|uniref:class I SAM-dependent methyltransferase n=1 Tax=Streptomyces sp. NBC_00859 TaxID=2903682 RepID=UPI0038699618|nr:class I SAM-dependent methyltransferase [Streptomyces sp. NBC_00859]